MLKSRLLAGLMGMFWVLDASAAESPVASVEAAESMSPAGAISASYVLELFLALALVLALIYGLSFVLKRMTGETDSGASVIRVLTGVSLGQRERLVLVQVGEQQMLIGTAPGSVNRVHVFDEPIVDPEDYRSMSRLSDLSALIGQRGGASS